MVTQLSYFGSGACLVNLRLIQVADPLERPERFREWAVGRIVISFQEFQSRTNTLLRKYCVEACDLGFRALGFRRLRYLPGLISTQPLRFRDREH